MKSETNKKIGLTSSLATLLGLPIKTFGNSSNTGVAKFGEWSQVQGSIYGVPKRYSESALKFSSAMVIFDSILVIITFFVGIISFFKIRKIEDKDLKHIKIKKSLWVILILILLIVLVSALLWMLKKGLLDDFF